MDPKSIWEEEMAKVSVQRDHVMTLQLTNIYTNVVDEWDYAAQKLIRSFRMPANSGPVSCVASMPNGKHIIW